MSSHLVAFLRARLDEDEAWGRNPECGYQQDPDRVLREVQAKRAILELHKPDRDPGDEWYGHDVRCEECGGITGSVDRGGLHGFQRSWPCRTLRHLAAVYGDHPDYAKLSGNEN